MKLDMVKMMKQVQAMQEEMQRRLAEARERLRSTTVVGSAGGGLIEVEMNGERELIRVSLKPETFRTLGFQNLQEEPTNENIRETAQELSDLIFAAVNSALAKAERLNEEVMSAVSRVPGVDPSSMGDILSILQGKT